jgi:4-hydroxybenzoate polyprenyltransferase
VKRWRAFVILVNPEYIGLATCNVFVSSLFVLGMFPPLRQCLVWGAFSAGSCFLNVVNNIVDREVDRINKPSRPIPRGIVTLGEAKVFALLLAIATLAFVLPLGSRAISPLVFFLLLALQYSLPPLRLRERFLGATYVGIFSHGVLPLITTAIVFEREVGWLPALVFGGLVGSIVPVKDIEDMRGDAMVGRSNLPLLVGVERTLDIVCMSLLSLLGFTAACGFRGVAFSIPHAVAALSCVPLVLAWRWIVSDSTQARVVTQSRTMSMTMALLGFIEFAIGLASVFSTNPVD